MLRRRDISEKTRDNYAGVWRRHVRAGLGSRRLDGITRADVRELIAVSRRAGWARPRLRWPCGSSVPRCPEPSMRRPSHPSVGRRGPCEGDRPRVVAGLDGRVRRSWLRGSAACACPAMEGRIDHGGELRRWPVKAHLPAPSSRLFRGGWQELGQGGPPESDGRCRRSGLRPHPQARQLGPPARRWGSLAAGGTAAGPASCCGTWRRRRGRFCCATGTTLAGPLTAVGARPRSPQGLHPPHSRSSPVRRTPPACERGRCDVDADRKWPMSHPWEAGRCGAMRNTESCVPLLAEPLARRGHSVDARASSCRGALQGPGKRGDAENTASRFPGANGSIDGTDPSLGWVASSSLFLRLAR
jgi:hypothetical protein